MLETDESDDTHRGRPTNTLLLVLLTICWTVLSAGTLFHSDCSHPEPSSETNDSELQLTIFFKVQYIVKGGDNLIFDVSIESSEMTIESRAENRNMVWIIVSIVS